MKKILVSLLLFAASSSFANLSAAVKGKLTSYNYGNQGYYLTFQGDAAQELFTSIQYSGGIVDKMETSTVDSKNKLVTKITTIYSKSMSCSQSMTNLTPIGKDEVKYSYQCELDISKNGAVQTPARG